MTAPQHQIPQPGIIYRLDKTAEFVRVTPVALRRKASDRKVPTGVTAPRSASRPRRQVRRRHG
jgi:hypothetical protein